jgi:hypothetical protein
MMNIYLRREIGKSVIWDFVLRTPERFKIYELLSFVVEDEGPKIFQNVRNYLTNDTLYYETSAVRGKCYCS